jgi:hypothetical protein
MQNAYPKVVSMAYRPVTAQEAPLLLWQTLLDMHGEALATFEVWPTFSPQRKHWLLLAIELVVLSSAPFAEESRHDGGDHSGMTQDCASRRISRFRAS